MNDTRMPPSRVAEPEVARVGVVVVAGLADESQAEHVAVEGGRAVEVRADRGDVVQPREPQALRLPGRPGSRPGHTRNPMPPAFAWNARRSAKKQSV